MECLIVCADIFEQHGESQPCVAGGGERLHFQSARRKPDIAQFRSTCLKHWKITFFCSYCRTSHQVWGERLCGYIHTERTPRSEVSYVSIWQGLQVYQVLLCSCYNTTLVTSSWAFPLHILDLSGVFKTFLEQDNQWNPRAMLFCSL